MRPMAACILGHAAVGMEARYFPITPAYAVQKLLKKHDLTVDDIDLFEVNEAFAADYPVQRENPRLGPGEGERQRWCGGPGSPDRSQRSPDFADPHL